MERTNNTGWIVAAVLAVVIVILLAMMWQEWNKQSHDLGMVLQSGQESIAAARDQISADCEGPQGTASANCTADLNQLSTILSQFSNSIKTASSTASSTSTY